MGRDYRDPDMPVTEDLLEGPDVVAVLKQMGLERMTERVAARGLGRHGSIDAATLCVESLT